MHHCLEVWLVEKHENNPVGWVSNLQLSEDLKGWELWPSVTWSKLLNGREIWLVKDGVLTVETCLAERSVSVWEPDRLSAALYDCLSVWLAERRVTKDLTGWTPVFTTIPESCWLESQSLWPFKNLIGWKVPQLMTVLWPDWLRSVTERRDPRIWSAKSVRLCLWPFKSRIGWVPHFMSILQSDWMDSATIYDCPGTWLAEKLNVMIQGSVCVRDHLRIWLAEFTLCLFRHL